jgi:WD40 repeat protein
MYNLFHHKSYRTKSTLILPIGHTGPVFRSEFRWDEKRILTVSADGTAKVWDENGWKASI